MRTRLTLITSLVLLALAFAGAGRVAFAQAATLPAAMIDVEWNLVGMQTAPGTTADTTGKGITIKFDNAGKISGSGGCNNYFGGYTVGANNALTFSAIGSTMMACEGDVGTRETAYLMALGTVSSYELSGNTLKLTFDNGKGVLTYTNGAPTKLPTTGGAEDNALWLAALGIVCIGAGLWFARRRSVARVAADNANNR